ncbi:MAG: glutamyl-tRNA reductase [Thermoplasmataceae archaeon]
MWAACWDFRSRREEFDQISRKEQTHYITELRSLGLKQFMLLSTCNRLEVYFIGRQPFQFPTDMPNPAMIHGEKCVEHLFRVASGLESLSVGENEILGQLTEAFERSQLLGICYGNLSAIVMKAIAVGKKVREKTEISRGKTSIAHIATDIALQEIEPGARVAIVGSGTMARKIAKYLSEHDVNLEVFARRPSEVAASEWPRGVIFRRLNELYEHLPEFGAIFTATSAKSPILDHRDFSGRVRNAIIVDVSIPPNVSSEVSGLSGIKLISLHDIESEVRKSLDKKISSIREAEAIVTSELRMFLLNYGKSSSDSVISNFYKYADIVRDRETRRLIAELNIDDEKVIRSITAMSNSMAKKFLHPLSSVLKLLASIGKGNEDIEEAMREIQNHLQKYLKSEDALEENLSDVNAE